MARNKTKVVGLVFLILFVVSALNFPVTIWAMGLEVNPGEIDVNGVVPGEKMAVSALGGDWMKLRIENKGGSSYTYTINILPSTGSCAPLKVGYTCIPDSSWITPEKKEVLVAGKSTEAVEIYIKVPKKKEYYNKKYQAVIEVKNKKNKPDELFVLACQLRICFSTVKE